MSRTQHNSLAGRTAELAGCLLLAAPYVHAATLTVDPSKQANASTFATIAQALKQVEPGDTVLVANGLYREVIDLRPLQAKPNDSRGRTILAAAPGARPVIKGSDLVTGWRRIDEGLYAKSDWTANSQQVFVDGQALKQIAGLLFDNFPLNPRHPLASLHRSQGGIWPGRTGKDRTDLVAESFYYDSDDRTLYIKSSIDIRRARVEVSVRPYVVIGTQVDSIELRGLAFEHANTTAHGQSGAISLTGNRLVLDSLDVRDVDGSGMDITGDDNRIVNSRAIRCGMVGMKVRGRNAQLINNETSFNNTRGFNKWWEAGGAKFVGAGGLQDSEIRGHRAYANNGDGLWFDWHNNNNRVHASVSAYNRGMGIHYEASHRARLHDNYVVGNTQRGIYLPNSSESVIEHNLVAANGMEGIVIIDERHAAASGTQDLLPKGNRVRGNVLAWNVKTALVMPTALQELDNASNDNLFVGAEQATFSLGWPSREQPASRSLEDWRKRTSQDITSAALARPPSPDITRQLDSQEPFAAMYPTWHTLLSTLPTKTPTVTHVIACLDTLRQLPEISR